MLFATPSLSAASKSKLEELDELRLRLGREARRPVRWMGALRRSFRAADANSSTAIEGYTVSEADALSLVDGADPVDPSDSNMMAVSCYARAMDHVAAMAGDPTFHWCDRVIKDLHFDASFFDWSAEPGRWRDKGISVTAGNGTIAYRAPDANEVAPLMEEVVAWLHQGDLSAHVVVRAAMAHLHVVSVHPFTDGNGRVSRIVQSLVLARDGLLAPDLASIEQHLGDHTSNYYNALRAVQGGSYQPQRDASSWVRFCIDAHLAQAHQRLALIENAARRWARLEALVAEHPWPDRLTIALEQALFGRTDRTAYGREADVSPATASADLRRLADAGLLAQEGRTRNAHYRPTDMLRKAAGA
jgi:Fic family protein